MCALTGWRNWVVSEARVSMRDWKAAFHFESIKWIIKFYSGESLFGARSGIFLIKTHSPGFIFLNCGWTNSFRWFFLKKSGSWLGHMFMLYSLVFCDTCVLLKLNKNGVIPSSQVPFYFLFRLMTVIFTSVYLPCVCIIFHLFTSCSTSVLMH